MLLFMLKYHNYRILVDASPNICQPHCSQVIAHCSSPIAHYSHVSTPPPSLMPRARMILFCNHARGCQPYTQMLDVIKSLFRPTPCCLMNFNIEPKATTLA